MESEVDVITRQLVNGEIDLKTARDLLSKAMQNSWFSGLDYARRCIPTVEEYKEHRAVVFEEIKHD